jgi:hypothetical protein
MTIDTEQFSPPEQRVLESMALQHLRQIGQYRMMTAERRDAYATRQGNAAREYAQALITSGSSEPGAWSQAIRLEILGSESD